MDVFDYILKIVIVGDSGVGKSCLMRRYCDDSFNEYLSSTIGVDFRTKLIEINDAIFKLYIWDSAGQEKFRYVRTLYYKGADIVLLVFDLTNAATFWRLEDWMTEINTAIPNGNHKIILVGNKCDNDNDNNDSIQQINDLDITSFATKYKIPYIETSAKTNINVTEVFTKIIKDVSKYPRSHHNRNNVVLHHDQYSGCGFCFI